jgi:hypothetical protein
VQRDGGLLDAQARKAPALHDAALPCTQRLETGQRMLEVQQFLEGRQYHGPLVVQRQRNGACPSLRALACAGIVDQDPPHQASCHRKEVYAVVPLDLVHIHQLEVCLMDQRRGVERVPCWLVPEQTVRNAVEFVIQDGDQLIERTLRPADAERSS